MFSHFVHIANILIGLCSLLFSGTRANTRTQLSFAILKQLDRTNVAIIAKFASTHLKDSEFIVATTHLLFNPRRDDVRIAQIQVLLAELDRLAVHSKTTQPLPIILTGDFNSEQLSPPYRLITEGCIDAYNLPIKMEIMDNCQHFNVATNQSRTKTKVNIINLFFFSTSLFTVNTFANFRIDFKL